jgi:predicted ATPase/transcriptional regulator with XRE-family HTH domain
VARFGDLVREHRLGRGLTQEELAERAQLSVRGLRYAEQGLRRPNRDTVERLIVALALDPGQGEALHAAARPRSLSRPRPPGAVLPLPGGPLIGREREVGTVTDLLLRPAVRVLTLTGPGGIGKTRLALEVAARLQRSALDEVVWVPLAAVSEPDLVLAAIAAAVGLRDAGAAALPEAFGHAFENRRMLLLLDNFEQVASAAEGVADLALRFPQLLILITSRVALRLRTGHDVAVAPLPTPGAEDPVSVQALATNPAVDLFLRRAQAVQADFALRQPDAAAVAAICRRLEGIPLALELAAARIPVLPPPALLARLDHRLTLLRDAAPDAPERQRTMRATIGWSYDLLRPQAQRLFRALAVFEGGVSLAAVEAVHGSREPETDLLDTLEELQQNSLLQLMPSTTMEPRYRMFETIREFADEQLTARGELELEQAAHGRYCLALAEDAARAAFGPAAASWLDRLDDEFDNLRAALRRSVIQQDAETALRLAAALWSFWYVRGYAAEGQAHVTAALALPTTDSLRAIRAQVLLGAGQIAITQGDYAQARTWLADSVALCRSLGDRRGLAEALLGAGFAARVQEESQDATDLLYEALATARSTGHTFIEAASLHHLGLIAADVRGDLPAARRLLEESLALYRRVQLPRFVSLLHLALGDLARASGDLPGAQQQLRESLMLMERTGERLGIHGVLDAFAELATVDGHVERAVRLAGAADRLRRRQGTQSWPLPARRREKWLIQARTSLGEDTFGLLWRTGGDMSVEAAVELALDDDADA